METTKTESKWFGGFTNGNHEVVLTGPDGVEIARKAFERTSVKEMAKFVAKFARKAKLTVDQVTLTTVK